MAHYSEGPSSNRAKSAFAGRRLGKQYDTGGDNRDRSDLSHTAQATFAVWFDTEKNKLLWNTPIKQVTTGATSSRTTPKYDLASASTAKAISAFSRAPKSSPTLCGRSRSPECLGLTGRLATSLTYSSLHFSSRKVNRVWSNPLRLNFNPSPISPCHELRIRRAPAVRNEI